MFLYKLVMGNNTELILHVFYNIEVLQNTAASYSYVIITQQRI